MRFLFDLDSLREWDIRFRFLQRIMSIRFSLFGRASRFRTDGGLNPNDWRAAGYRFYSRKMRSHDMHRHNEKPT